MIISNPLVERYNQFWSEQIKSKFSPSQQIPEEVSLLSLKNYLLNSPQKYYSELSFTLYYNFLHQLKVKDFALLKKLLNESCEDISVSNRVLNEVNLIERQDNILPKNDSETINLIQNQIMYNYLRILEAPFYVLMYVAAKHTRIERSASTDKLDIYNVASELSNTPFQSITKIYNNVLRNSIAHGKFSISSLSNLINFTFYDKKGNKVEYESRAFVNMFDNLLDITNGLYLAYKLFCLINYEELKSKGCNVATSIYIDEIVASTNGPSWELINIYEINRNNRKYLSIYINSNFISESYDFLNSVNTSAVTLKYFQNHEIIYVDIKSKWTKISTFNFNVDKIKKAIDSNWKHVENNLVELKFWLPKYKYLSNFSKLQLLFLSFSQEFKLLFLKRKYNDVYKSIEILINEFDSRKTYSIINARCIVPIDNNSDLRIYIKENYERLIYLAKRNALGRTSIFSPKIHIPITFIRLYIYPRNLRKRQILFRPISSGLFSTIEWDKDGSFPASEIFDNSTFEMYGRYRITWDEDQ